MLQLSLCGDPARVAVSARACGRVPGPSLYLYRAEDRGQELAACLFEVGPDRVTALRYESGEEDPFLFDALLRAGLNYAAGQGIATGCIPEHLRAEFARFFRRLNYPAPTSFDITNFFQKYKSCRPGGTI